MTPAPDEYRFSDQIGHLLRRAYQRHVAIFQQTVELTFGDLSPQERVTVVALLRKLSGIR